MRLLFFRDQMPLRHPNYTSKLQTIPIVILSLILLGPLLNYAVPVDELFYLKAGLDFIDYGLSPWVDHYSFTYFNEPLKSYPFLYGVIFATFEKLSNLIFSYKSIQLFNYTAVIFSLIYYHAKLNINWKATLLVTTLAIGFIIDRHNPRPEFLTYSFIPLALYLYFKSTNDFSSRNLIKSIFLLIVWTNWHTSIFGYIIFFALFIDQITISATKHQQQKLYPWLAWGLLFLLAGFLNPTFAHPVIDAFYFDKNGWEKIIYEWRELDTSVNNHFMPQVNQLVVASIFSIFTLFSLRRIGLAFIVGLSIFYTFKLPRLAPQTSLIILLATSYCINYHVTQNKKSVSKRIQTTLLIILSALTLFNIHTAMNKPASYYGLDRFNKLKPENYPTEEIALLKKINHPANVFSSIALGSKLLYFLPTNYKIFWDGRMGILYPLAFPEKYVKSGKGFGRYFLRATNDYPIDYIILNTNNYDFAIISAYSNFQLKYISNNFFLFEKSGQHNIPDLGLNSKISLSPNCWTPELLAPMLTEFNNLHDTKLTVGSRLQRQAEILKKYSNDPTSISNITPTDHNTDIRLLAFMHVRLESYDEALKLFSSLKDQSDLDRLFMLLCLQKLNKWGDANNLLSFFLSKATKDSIELSPAFDIAFLATLMEKSKSIPPKTKLEADNFERIIARTKQKNFPYKIPLDDISQSSECAKVLNISQTFSKHAQH